MPARARPRGESWTGPFLPGRLLVFVVLAGPVRRRILVGLPDPLDPVDFLDVLRDHGGNEGFPVAALQHPVSDFRAGEAFAVDERGRQHLETVLPEEPHHEVRVRVDGIEPRHEGRHVAHPDAMDVGVRDWHDVVFVDALRVECALDHLVPLARGERILARVAVLRRPDSHNDFVVRLEDPFHGREVPAVERLEPTDEQRAAAHSSSSDMKWSMYGHSSVRNLRQWTHRPSSWAGPRTPLDS